MQINSARNRPVARFVIGIAIELSLCSLVRLQGSCAELVVVQDTTQSSDSREKFAPASGVCEREAAKLVGQNAIRIGRSVRAPKKLRDVRPKYPALPPGTVGSGVWLGEVLVSHTGKVVRVWPIHEVTFVPPFPGFNNAITDAIQRWEFEPLLVRRKPAAFCMAVTVFINWQ